MSAHGPLILTVDDDADLLRLLTLRLQSIGYRIATAGSGKEALASMALARPQAVITDLRMAGMDGMALFERIHAQDPALPVIVLTAHGSIPDAVQATQQGVFGYLTKPFDTQELIQLLARAVALPGATKAACDETWCDEIVTANSHMQALLAEARLVADSESGVMIRGESGTGKELLARAIHRASPRRGGPFVAVNCAAIPEPLLESELFGHVKGAFTGALGAHKGLFQAADGGSLFLDEIGDLPLGLQVKLLRVLQDLEVRPVGSSHAVAVDVRILSATHRDLEAAIAAGEFREDLYYRLNVVSLAIPPLRERREDIPLLVRQFLTVYAERNPHRVNGFTPEAMEMLTAFDWPGNVRQLGNVVEQCCALCAAPLAPASLVLRALGTRPATALSYAEAKDRFEQDYLTSLMKSTHGNVAAAARLAGRNRTEFYRLLQKHGLSPDLFKADA
jgi:two-component system, NtrC family, response regulator GlrR